MFTKTAVVLCILAIATSGFSVRPSAKNTVRNAHEQLTKKIWFWEPIEENIAGNHFSGEHHLSEPINKFRSNICDPKDFNKGYVNGVDIDSACYTNVLSFFHITHPRLALLNVCLQEIHTAGRPSQTSIHCKCKIDGCNLPKRFTTFVDFNKLPMPETSF